MTTDKTNSNKFFEIIEQMDKCMENFLEIFNKIGKIDQQENEDNYFRLVGQFSKHLRNLLDVYFDKETKRIIQLEFKPQILYFRQVQHYLVFILRYPDILKVSEHDEIQQTRKFLENKDYLVEVQYNALAKHETQLFEGNFRDILDKKLSKSLK